MKGKKFNLLTQIVLILVSLALSTASASAQNAPLSQIANAPVKTDSRMLYHGGPVRTFVQNVYFIFYGCWTGTCASADDTTAMNILGEFIATIGNTPYMMINSTYPDFTGPPASGAIVYAGMVVNSGYPHGLDLTQSDIEAIITDQIGNFGLPQDPQGIYIVVASADVASNETGFCTPGAPPFHSSAVIYGLRLPYVFIGNPNRCATVAGWQFLPPSGGSTPNGNFAADAMVGNLAHALNGLLTNPFGNAWYDRYGLENADKCTGTFGQTYTTANGARANIRLGSRDFLLEQNWVNNRKGFCSLSR